MKIKISLIPLLVSLIFVGCSKTDDAPENSMVTPEPTAITPDQIETSAYKELPTTPEQRAVTNIYRLNQETSNVELANSISGYLVYKTKSCLFDPPYSQITTCDPDSGYIILSDSKTPLEEDPQTEKVTLKENQVLMFHVPDSVISKLEMRKAYNFRGITTTYKDFTSMRYSGINDLLDCKKLEDEIDELYGKANYCDNDADCTYKSKPAFDGGCGHRFNKEAPLVGAYVKEKLFLDCRCRPSKADCAAPEALDLKCIDKKCDFVEK